MKTMLLGALRTGTAPLFIGLLALTGCSLNFTLSGTWEGTVTGGETCGNTDSFKQPTFVFVIDSAPPLNYAKSKASLEDANVTGHVQLVASDSSRQTANINGIFVGTLVRVKEPKDHALELVGDVLSAEEYAIWKQNRSDPRLNVSPIFDRKPGAHFSLYGNVRTGYTMKGYIWTGERCTPKSTAETPKPLGKFGSLRLTPTYSPLQEWARSRPQHSIAVELKRK